MNQMSGMGPMGGSCHGSMAGLPPSALGLAAAAAVLLTGWSLWRGASAASGASGRLRFDLTSLRPVRWAVTRRPFQFSVQLPLVLALFLILSAGFLGSPVAERNIATVLTWTFWWTLLIVDIVLLGRMWCLVCPWDALASWIRRLALWRRRSEEPLSLGLPWPRWLRSVTPATVLFIGLTWLELGFGVTRSPRATAILGLLMVLLAVVPALIFERRSFCRYACLIGRICGLYSMLAPVEVRPRSMDACASCRTRECLTGNGKGYPCPTGQCLPAMKTNAYCTVCTECVKSCPSGNVAINIRPWGGDLLTFGRPRRDEAVLALVMLSLTCFHGLTMTPAWSDLLAWMRGAAGIRHLTAFSLGMAGILVLPAALYLLTSSLAVRAALPSPRAGARRAALAEAAGRYAYPLIAVALMYHLAHNAGHLLNEAGSLLPVLSDPFGSGLDLFGTAAHAPGPLAAPATVWAVQILLVLGGLLWALRATERAGTSLAARWRLPRLPWPARALAAAYLLAITASQLWLLAQPMEMRTGM